MYRWTSANFGNNYNNYDQHSDASDTAALRHEVNAWAVSLKLIKPSAFRAPVSQHKFHTIFCQSAYKLCSAVYSSLLSCTVPPFPFSLVSLPPLLYSTFSSFLFYLFPPLFPPILYMQYLLFLSCISSLLSCTVPSSPPSSLVQYLLLFPPI